MLLGLVSGYAAVAQEAESSAVTSASDPSGPLDASGNLVAFERDIAPILRSRCLECHGPDVAKEDFRVDQRDTFMGYVEAGDVQSSILYTDYLTSEDDDMQMPPKAKQGPLSPGELALIRVWIEEGADWPDSAQVILPATKPETETETPVSEEPMILGQRVWRAIGYLHPATIHFPIALFTLGAGFVVLSLKWPALGTQIPLACLLIGTAAAIAAATMGWSLAPTKGYGEGWEFLNFDRDVDAHRWTALIVVLVACLSSIIAISAIWNGSQRLTKLWKAGLLICGITVGLVGHQGGELTYGRDFYPEMIRILLGETDPPAENQISAADATAVIQSQ